MMVSVAPNGEFDGRCFILNSNDGGWGSEIDDIPRRLVLSIFAF